ncbi:DUF5610 domain-containing protein [Undibacterium sp.]|uniref:DUF5610 domain-containing protein n=1 Tax=Undibacterium sp. TaxID=1914977 RepID=UPI00374D3665
MTSAVSFNPSAANHVSQNIFAANSADLKKSALPASYSEYSESVNASASTKVTIASKNDPMPLVYKSAINAINEALKSGSGTDALQKAAGGDNSPEGTADRIVSMATGFLGEYQKQHPDEDSATALNNFMGEIRSGFEKGFAEAGKILMSLGTMNDKITASLHKTHDLVTKGFDDFESAQKAAIAAGKAADATDGSAPPDSASTGSSTSASTQDQSQQKQADALTA